MVTTTGLQEHMQEQTELIVDVQKKMSESVKEVQDSMEGKLSSVTADVIELVEQVAHLEVGLPVLLCSFKACYPLRVSSPRKSMLLILVL